METADLREAQAVSPAGQRSTLIADGTPARYALFCLEPGQAVPSHVSPSAVSLTVLEGEGSVTGGEGAAPLAPGTMVLFAPNEPHGFTARTRLVALAAITPRPS
jgi:quercetin dioxygenase-like cupin family protein